MKKIIIGLSLLLLAGCSDPKNTVLPDDLSKIDQIKGSIEKLNKQDQQMLIGYVMRHGVAHAFGEPSKEGVTIKDALEEQKNIEIAATKEKLDEQKKIAEKKAIAEKINSLVEFSITDTPKIRNGVLTFHINLKNKSGKNIEGVKTDFSFIDTFDYVLYTDEIRVTYSGVGIVPDYVDNIEYSSGVTDKDYKNLSEQVSKVKFETSHIVFSDGTSLKVD